MKIKADFVTNSSSSSFIVAFPKKVKHLREVKAVIPHKYAETVFKDATNQKPLAKISPKVQARIAQQIGHGYIDDPRFPDAWDQDKKFAEREGASGEGKVYDNPQWRELFWDERNLKQNSFSYTLAGEFLEQVPDEYYIYVFHYGDEDGEYFSEMEHNNIFRKIPSLRINKH